MDSTNGQCFELNQTGSEIWNELQKGSCVGEVIKTVSARYSLQDEQAEADVWSLVDELLRRGLLRTSAP